MTAPSIHLVDAVWRALQAAPSLSQPHALLSFVKRHGASDYVPSYSVDDLLHDLGFGNIANVPDALEAFSVECETLFTRPSGRARVSVGGTFVRIPAVAGLLIKLERIGLSVDPTPIVDALRPGLAAKRRLTHAELDVFWHKREQHRMPPVLMASADEPTCTIVKQLRTTGQYRVEAWIEAEGRAAQLWVRAPKYRSRPRAKGWAR